MTMSEPLDLAAIRERSDRYMSLADRFDEDGNLPGLKSQATGYAIGLSATLTAADVPALLAEVERLRAEVARYMESDRHLTAQVGGLRALVDREHTPPTGGD